MSTSSNTKGQAPQIRVLFLGPLHHALHVREVCIPCPPDGSQESFWDALLEQLPDLRASRAVVRLARKQEFLHPEDTLEPGDEVALIPPVSGG